MKPRREDTLFVNNDCLHGKSNRNFRQILDFFFQQVYWKEGQLEKPIFFLYTNNEFVRLNDKI